MPDDKKQLAKLYKRKTELEEVALENYKASGDWYPEEHLDDKDAEEYTNILFQIDELSRGKKGNGSDI